MLTHEMLATPGNTVLILSLISAIAHIPSVLSSPSYPRMATKTASTALLSALAYQRGGPLLLAGALALGSLGDAFLAWEGEGNFLCGLASFLAAHILYVILFAQSGGGKEQLLAETWRVGTATVFVVILAPTMTALLVPRVAKDLRLPIIAYTATIGAMVLAALTADSQLVVAGAALFSTSDSILAAEKFLIDPASPHSPWMKYAVWVLYYSGQLLIALGFVPGEGR